MRAATRLRPDLEFTQSQFSIYDQEVTTVAKWTENHIRQGFVRLPQVIAFNTLMESGNSKLFLLINDDLKTENNFDRIIEVPLEITSGKLAIDGPEEYPLDRHCVVDPGHYIVTVAQIAIREWEQEIWISIRKQLTPAIHSRILLPGGLANPPSPLIETAEPINN